MPDNFPDNATLLVETEDTEGKRLTLPLSHREFVTPELKCFFEQMVTKMHPSGHNFFQDKTSKCISEMLSSSDEAFALLVMYNESHRWKADAEIPKPSEVCGKRKRSPTKGQKKFNNSDSGDRDGWSRHGRLLYQQLTELIERKREDKITGEIFEEQLKLAFVEEMEEDKDDMEMPVLGIKDEELNGYFPKGWQGVMKNIGAKVVNV